MRDDGHGMSFLITDSEDFSEIKPGPHLRVLP